MSALHPDFAPVLRPDGSHDWPRCPCNDCKDTRDDMNRDLRLRFDE